ncbi:glycoside hydrolase family 66 protein [Anaerocolumna jejuensis]|uniref:glycoside hydrolase family 66 protein n=1 Tax=Anaerocolumna jejuensis TaxID=259063 RepID=UPI003F7B749A
MNKYISVRKRDILLTGILLIFTLFFSALLQKVYADGAAEASGIYVTEVHVDKACYGLGDTVTVTAVIKNASAAEWSGKIYLKIFHNDQLMDTKNTALSLSAGTTASKTFTWTPPMEDYKGYLVQAYTKDSDSKTTAIDVSSEPSRFPRYGYIQNFDEEIKKNTIEDQVNTLTQDYHINLFQFYDWMWRHEVPIKRSDGTHPDKSWLDLFDRTISWDTLTGYINAVHNKNAAAMAYMMSYAAREGYTDYKVSPSWGMFKDTGHQSQFDVDFGNGRYLWMFAPTNALWQDFICKAYTDVVNTMNFDGIQMDQMGQRNNVFDYNGNSYDLKNSFSSLVNAAKKALQTNNAGKGLLDFNIVDGTVDGWALEDIAKNADTDFNFSEIWWLSNNYNQLRNYIEQLRGLSGGKAAVLAAYMNYNMNYGRCYEAEDASYNGVDVATDHPGYSGRGFLQNFAQQGDYVQFTIHTEEAMTYALVFQYGDKDAEATRTIYLDGNKIGQVGFHAKGNWDTYAHDAYMNTYLSAGSHTIKVSYDAVDKGAINLDSLTLGEFEESSIRLADAAIAASGASHIELGAGLDDVTMLGSEYYPNTSKVMSGDLKTAMKEYYKFITAYENLLYDPEITYSDQGNQYISINGQNISGDGRPGTIWHMTRMTEEYDILHLINLTAERDSEWRNPSAAPGNLTKLEVKYYLSPDAPISGVYTASPDYNGGGSQELNYETGSDNTGTFVTFTLPSLEYWDMVYIRRSVAAPKDGIYEAEKAVKTGVTVNTNHAGYTGTGFLDSFAEPGDEVTFQILAPSDKQYALNFRYSNHTGSSASRHVYIDGNYAGVLKMSDLSSWDTWENAALSAYLKKGVHTVSIYYDGSDSKGINLDSLKVN